MRRLFVLSVALGSLVLWASPQVWAHKHNMAGMPPTTFPNNYTVNNSYSFDPNLGSAGTLYINYRYTGTTQQSPMCNSGATHYPIIAVQVYNNGTAKSYHHVTGSTRFAPCAQMDETLTIAFDLGSDQCSLDLFIEGTCTLAEETDEIYCTSAGAFVFLLQKFQFEYAHAQMQTVGDAYPFPQQPNCAGLSNPPDWWIRNGLTYGTTGYRNAAAEVVRSQFIGLTFTGRPWFQIQPFGFPTDVPAGPPVICTQNDNGCVWGATSCTGTPTK